MTSLHVVCALDKFKGSVDAVAAGGALAAGIRASVPGAAIDVVPVADGGDGTVDAAIAAGMRELTAVVAGPTGQPVRARFAARPPAAVVELAEACGIRRLPGGELRPWDAHTTGLGQLIAAALDAGCTDIVVGVGGSASTDVGLGLLCGLGARLLDAYGDDVTPGAGELARIATIDLTGLRADVRSARLRIAADVDNPVLGPSGAVATFGAQKGVEDRDLDRLESGVAHAVAMLGAVTGIDLRNVAGMGAAGGVPAALVSVLGASVIAGAEYVLDLADFEARLRGADFVITGEGSFDDQTLRGKAPSAVLRAARRLSVPVVVVAGRVDMPPETWREHGVVALWSLEDRAVSVRDSMRRAPTLLAEIGADIGRWMTAPARGRPGMDRAQRQ